MRGGKRPNAGNKKGNKHEKTMLWEEFGKIVLTEGLGRALGELNTLKGEKYLLHYEKFLQYFKTRSTKVELLGELDRLPNMPTEELDGLIESLYKKVMSNEK